MIVALIIIAVFGLMSLIISFFLFFIPNEVFVSGDIVTIVDLIKKSSVFVPSDVLFMLITSIVGWYIARLLWAIVEWLYKKIPGVN